MTMKRMRWMGIVLLPILLLPALLQAGESAPAPEERAKWVVLYRTFAMQGIMAHMRGIGLILEQKANNPAHLVTHAQGLHQYALQMEDIFREKAMDDDSIAKETIWEQWPRFQEQSRSFANTTRRLLEATKAGNEPNMHQAMDDLGAACKECHKLFRSKR